MWQDLDGLGGAGVNSGAHQVDQFSTTELTPEHQKILIDIRRKKTELLLEIQCTNDGDFCCGRFGWVKNESVGGDCVRTIGWILTMELSERGVLNTSANMN